MKVLSFLTFSILLVGLFSATSPGQIPNIQISTPYPQLQNEEQVFYCPTDENVIVATWRDFRLGYRQCGIGRSTDGGLTWSDQLNSLLLDGASRQTDPAMTVDGLGNYYCCYMDGNNVISALIVIKSTDKGDSWDGPHIVVASLEHFEDKEFITCDRTGGPYDGNIYVVWSRSWMYQDDGDTSAVMFLRSTDGGLTYVDLFEVSPTRRDIRDGSRFIGSDLFAQPVVGSDGSVYVFFTGYDGPMDECDSSASLYMSKSTDGGQTWPIIREKIYQYSGIRTRVVDGQIDVFYAPAGDADITGGPFDGNIYISSLIFNDGNPYGDGDIVVMRSTDGGSSWSDPVRVNNDPPGFDVDQFHNWLIVNQDGVIVVVFYDQRLDPNHYMFDVFAAYSFDGGETFTTNHRITNVSSDPTYLGKAGSIAEYIGVTAFHEKITAVWTDLRNLNQDVYAATYDLPFLKPRLLDVSDKSYLASVPESLAWANSWYLDDVSYRLEVSTDPEFGDFVINTAVEDNQYTLSGEIVDDGLYYWRVKAFRAIETDSSEYSDVWLFGIDREVPVAAIPSSPSDGEIIIDYQPSLSWSTVKSTAVSPEFYGIEVSGDPLFSGDPPYFYYDGIAETTFQVPDALPGPDVYYWHVNHYDLAGHETGYSDYFSFELVDYICGDANGDVSINVGDAVHLINHIFHDGPAPIPTAAGNVNCDGSINVGDAVYLINYIFRGGSPAPCASCA